MASLFFPGVNSWFGPSPVEVKTFAPARATDAGALPPTMTSSGTTSVEQVDAALAQANAEANAANAAAIQEKKKQGAAATGDWAAVGAGVAAGLAPTLISMFSKPKKNATNPFGLTTGGSAPKGMSTGTIVMIAGIAVLVLGVAGVGVYSATKKKD